MFLEWTKMSQVIKSLGSWIPTNTKWSWMQDVKSFKIDKRTVLDQHDIANNQLKR